MAVYIILNLESDSSDTVEKIRTNLVLNSKLIVLN